VGDLARAIHDLIMDKESRERLTSNALAFVSEYTWDKKEKSYLSLVGRLLGQEHC
jgi:glycosyltransferase involved in cell wall biosynthesis